jgi:hypothetical protein
MKLNILSLLALGFAASAAHASLLFEPYGGYSVGSVSATATGGGTSSSASVDGLTYGGLGGFMLDHFLILAYEYQGISATEKVSGVSSSYKWNQTNQFATIGFQAPQGLRLMGSYGFNVNAVDNSTTPGTTFTGSAYKFAIGWKILRHVAINAEYTIFNLTNASYNGTSSKISDSYSKFNYSQAMVNISFPFTFFGSGGGGSSGGGKTRP